jgi:hypothetical protein
MLLVLLALMGCASPGGHEAPAAWNNLNAGMTKQEISAQLGKPSGHVGPDRDAWRSSGWELQVTYDENGRARDIVRHPVGN